jgi:hypothetical protein
VASPSVAPPPSALTPEVLKRYVAKEGIGSPAQAAQIALLAWQNGDIAVAQFAAKIATNYPISKLIAGQDGDANSISWTDLGKLAKGKAAIGREDLGAAPELTETLASDLKAMANLAPTGAGQNLWDPYGTTAQMQQLQQQPIYPQQTQFGSIPAGNLLNNTGLLGGQPTTLNGVQGTVVMLPLAQAQQLQFAQQGQILQQTPIQQTLNLAGLGGTMSPLLQQAGLVQASPLQQQKTLNLADLCMRPLLEKAGLVQASPLQQQIAQMPAALSQPISAGSMLQQQPISNVLGIGGGKVGLLGSLQQQPVLQQQPLYQQATMGNMPITLPGNYRLALVPSF